MVEIAKLGALAMVGVVFLYGLKKDWEGVFNIWLRVPSRLLSDAWGTLR